MSVSTKKSKPVGKTVLYGCVSACLYTAVFAYADSIAQVFSLGGIYAALPIATVFVFSVAHGAFASNLWSVLGVEAVNKVSAPRPTAPAPRPAQRTRPRIRLSV